ncbi:MAG TPA: hypothetical protein PKC24_01180 [Cyclobacteriaceae bacterium]|nr:hypothetical protein [Cyclobacteriaceae bacterium]
MRTLIFTICLCSAVYSFGQEYRNTTTVFETSTKSYEGGLGFDISNRTINNTRYNYFSASLYPSYGKFIRENLLVGVGINLGYGLQTTDNTNSDYFETTNSYNIGIRPFIKKYYNLAPGFFIYGQANARYNYGWLNSEVEDFNFNQSNSGNSHNFGMSISPGISFFISPKFAIESRLFGINFFHTRAKDDFYSGDYSATNLSVGAGIGGINLALRYFIFPNQ